MREVKVRCAMVEDRRWCRPLVKLHRLFAQLRNDRDLQGFDQDDTSEQA